VTQAPRRVIDDSVRLLAHLLGGQVCDESLGELEVEAVHKNDVLHHVTLIALIGG
jgi:hypothetical protein